jgi:hypothetical protein
MKLLHTQIEEELPAIARARAIEVTLGSTSISQADPLYTFVGASVAVYLFDSKLSWCGMRQVII